MPAQAFDRIRPLPEAQTVKNGIPQAVVEAHVLHDVPIVEAWREHLGLTQQEMSDRAGLLQPALARLCRGGRWVDSGYATASVFLYVRTQRYWLRQ